MIRYLTIFAVLLAGGLPLAAAGASSKALRVDPSRAPGFSAVPVAVTGLRFTNVLTEADFNQNRILDNGSGVALGDVDGDGRCDIYLCSISGGNVLYRNLGDWKFADITASAGVACPGQHSTGAVFADVDGDGDLDLLVNSLGGGTRLFLNDGKGHFHESADSGLPSSGGSHSLALADVDGDGTLDVYVVNYRSKTFKDLPKSARIRLRNVNGRLTVPPDLAGQFILAKAADGDALVEIGVEVHGHDCA